MRPYRLFIDESGDHTYDSSASLDMRYLGLTGVLIRKNHYDDQVQRQLEDMKRNFFHYDPDDPPILVRSQIKSRKGPFYVLQDKQKSDEWEDAVLAFLNTLVPYTHVFTVVIDKLEQKKRYGVRTFDPYAFSLAVLLNRVRGWLKLNVTTSDVMAESRGQREDSQIQRAYQSLLIHGAQFGNGDYYRVAYPEDKLKMRRKDQNVAGLQLADLLAYGQKWLTVIEAKRPFPRPLTSFTTRINTAVNPMVNRYGRFMLT